MLMCLRLCCPDCEHSTGVIDKTRHTKATSPVVCRNGEFIFRSSNSVKPATDLPEDMMRRVRAATIGYCLRESHASTPNAPAGVAPKPRSSRASGRPSDRHRTKQKYSLLCSTWLWYPLYSFLSRLCHLCDRSYRQCRT